MRQTQTLSTERTPDTHVGTVSKRPAHLVMSESRAGAAYPNALSFSRTLVRKMQREKWHITLMRIDLDSEGRGEALYQIEANGSSYHFFVVSDYFSPEMKVDRAFGINWDVSAALCENEWTYAREANLRTQVPKQYAGRYDSGVLCFCRGNRSERVFDSVVNQLAAGEQPELDSLRSVGYLVRSTAFVGNGLFGMKPFDALSTAHPLGGTYQAQMLAAYLLREFALKLVETMARHRSPRAVTLDRNIKRYLGIGNSAGLGLVPFVTNHPLLIQRWVLTNEQAFADAKSRIITDAGIKQFIALTGKASHYFHTEPDNNKQIFAPYCTLRNQFEAVTQFLTANTSQWLSELATWNTLFSRPEFAKLHPETIEILNGLLLEVFPDIVERYENCFTENETLDNIPDINVSDMLTLIKNKYDWFISKDNNKDNQFFWYYCSESPYEPRRGLRHLASGYDVESTMDFPWLIKELHGLLQRENPTELLGNIVAQNPGLLATVTRIQAMRNAPYGELQINSLQSGFTPFAVCRFLLAFYGMEKFDPQPPRSTRGALMQGAPLIDELHNIESGDWPFVSLETSGQISRKHHAHLIPSNESITPSIQAETSGSGYPNKPVQSPEQHSSDKVHLFPNELKKMLTRALSAVNLPLGAAESAVRMLPVFMQLGIVSLDSIIYDIEGVIVKKPVFLDDTQVDIKGATFLAIIPGLIDAVCAKATHSNGNEKEACLILVNARPFLYQAPALLRGSERGFLIAMANPAQNTLYVSGCGTFGPWLMTFNNLEGILKQFELARANKTNQECRQARALGSLIQLFKDALAPGTLSAPHKLSAMNDIVLAAKKSPEIQTNADDHETTLRTWFDIHSTAEDKYIDSKTLYDANTHIKSNGLMLNTAAFEQLSTHAESYLLPAAIEKDVTNLETKHV